MTEAKGNHSHAEGCGTVANRNNQHAQGTYNIIDTYSTNSTNGKYADIVGNGKSDTERSNAYALDWSGNGYFTGDIYANVETKEYGAVTGPDEAKKLATVKYVDDQISEIKNNSGSNENENNNIAELL
jgi:hypothetical protein